MIVDACYEGAALERIPIRSDRNALAMLVLSHFRDANRYPLRWKML